MTIARSQLVSSDSVGSYHCIQRCVRRAFLCGFDRYSHRSFEHRKSWIEDRLNQLGNCFAVAIHAYAVMSNHLHVVLQIDPVAAAGWDDDEVAARWVRLFPPADRTEAAFEFKRQELLANPHRLHAVRLRLGSLSWFMRCLAEPIARRANREDDCKGRFWEGRYKCQLLCDERAMLAAMAYVDLNPVRVGVADKPENAVHTSIRKRIEMARAVPETLAEPLRSIIGLRGLAWSLTTAEYLQIVDWTGRATSTSGRHGADSHAPAVLSMVEADPARWMRRVRGYGGGWCRAVGSAERLLELAQSIGQRWMKGIRFAILLG